MMTASRPTFHFYKLAVLFSTHASELNRLYNVGSADGTAYSILYTLSVNPIHDRGKESDIRQRSPSVSLA
jgi:hypothetical protein